MRKLFFIPFICFLFSCAYKSVPLKGNYDEKPFELIVEKNKDVIWDNLIDFFATKGLSIKLIDRTSGLILSDRSLLTWTYEDAKGKLENPAAWVVLPKIVDPGTMKPVSFAQVYGDWNVRIKEIDKDKTKINVNLVNISYTSTIYAFMSTVPTSTVYHDGKSTKVFEKLISEQIK